MDTGTTLPAEEKGHWVTEENVVLPLTDSRSYSNSFSSPERQVPLEIICPGENCAHNTPHEWTCRNCMCLVYYGFHKHVYCQCGAAPANTLKFKYPNQDHGNEYIFYRDDLLTQQLSNITPPTEMNILILGETGVGKSTWINGFMNFVTYNSLQDAKDNKLLTLVPTKFSVFNTGDEGISVQHGPGDTMPALIKLLSENQDVKIKIDKSTVYCYDSEAYRFLAAVKNKPPVTFSETEERNFTDSWRTSVTEVERMLTYIGSLKPHTISSTLNLNHARQLVLKLARPLAEINKNIKLNTSIIEDRLGEIKETEDTIEALEAKRKTTITVIEITEIKNPKTVCSNLNCVQVMTIPGTNNSTNRYITECHSPCGLRGNTVKADSVGDAGLLQCAAINSNGNCNKCGHSYRQHLHVYYDSNLVPQVVDDMAVVEALKKNVSGKEMKAMMIKNMNTLIEEYKMELETVENASAVFACFLKHNAITPYNDAVEQYLEHFIKEETDKTTKDGSKTNLKNLQDSLDSYKVQKEIIEKNMAVGSGIENMDFNPESINERVKVIKKLKHSGEALQQALDCINYSSKNEIGKEAFQPVYVVYKRNGLTDKIKNILNYFAEKVGLKSSK